MLSVLVFILMRGKVYGSIIFSFFIYTKDCVRGYTGTQGTHLILVRIDCASIGILIKGHVVISIPRCSLLTEAIFNCQYAN